MGSLSLRAIPGAIRGRVRRTRSGAARAAGGWVPSAWAAEALLVRMRRDREEALEPEAIGPDEQWRLLQGLAETALSALIGGGGRVGARHNA